METPKTRLRHLTVARIIFSAELAEMARTAETAVLDTSTAYPTPKHVLGKNNRLNYRIAL
jgi:hypothetical protein